ncbi:MAG: DUF1993 domain-containing protein [Phenylobacterium sp.]|uniref:DUF1993 domain-containing protein n=1 Tax=Phenylobacterium sp. TaxID=1871053 RepID=UPI00273603C0|nr:DUF1993 domain-containing protein [Phenylobacterium sp.]MDP3173567.1 DUF1993 domain-containing protein [Phenylobacterium sp.]
MAIALYDLSVSNYLQALGAVAGFLDRGLAHCSDNNIDPQEIVGTRLFPDMLPFHFQVQSVAHHSLGAIQGVKAGLFQPPPQIPVGDYAGLQAMITAAQAGLQSLSAEEVNALEGREVKFKTVAFELPFVAENFLLSVSLPNFYFHATTAYDILRMKGVPIGKRDFMGKMRLKT